MTRLWGHILIQTLNRAWKEVAEMVRFSLHLCVCGHRLLFYIARKLTASLYQCRRQTTQAELSYCPLAPAFFFNLASHSIWYISHSRRCRITNNCFGQNRQVIHLVHHRPFCICLNLISCLFVWQELEHPKTQTHPASSVATALVCENTITGEGVNAQLILWHYPAVCQQTLSHLFDLSQLQKKERKKKKCNRT